MEHHQESCHDVLALLSDYVDFELPLADCGEVEKHLADCPACHPRSRFRAGHRIRKRALAGVLP